MTPKQWNRAIDLWNRGRKLEEIAADIGVGFYDLTRGDRLLGAVMGEIRRRVDAGEVMNAQTCVLLPDSLKISEI